jgi:hypothetical protein
VRSRSASGRYAPRHPVCIRPNHSPVNNEMCPAGRLSYDFLKQRRRP